MKFLIQMIFVIFLMTNSSVASEKQKERGTKKVQYKEPCKNFHATGLNLSSVAPFIIKLKNHLIKNEISKIAKLVNYPVRFNSRKKNKKIKDEKTFVVEFPKFTNKKWIAKVLNGSNKNSVCNSQGVGLNNGSLWLTAPRFHTQKDIIKIIAVNVY
jgi:hypothetical protein